jgi:hypothetical protein
MMGDLYRLFERYEDPPPDSAPEATAYFERLGADAHELARKYEDAVLEDLLIGLIDGLATVSYNKAHPAA